jgi:transcriptional regulator with XRE-family HTH domain
LPGTGSSLFFSSARSLAAQPETVGNDRQRLGISQEELAARCGLHRTYIGGIERGERNPSLINIGRIADALQVAVREMFTFPSGKSRRRQAT